MNKRLKAGFTVEGLESLLKAFIEEIEKLGIKKYGASDSLQLIRVYPDRTYNKLEKSTYYGSTTSYSLPQDWNAAIAASKDYEELVEYAKYKGETHSWLTKDKIYPVIYGGHGLPRITADDDSKVSIDMKFFTSVTKEEYEQQEKIKVGDWVTCVIGANKDDAGWGYDEGLTFKITSINDSSNPNIYFGCKNGNGVYADFIRKATKEEIEKATLVKIGGHEVKFLDKNTIKVGCQTIDRTFIEKLQKLYTQEVRLTIDSKEIPHATIHNILNALKDKF